MIDHYNFFLNCYVSSTFLDLDKSQSKYGVNCIMQSILLLEIALCFCMNMVKNNRNKIMAVKCNKYMIVVQMYLILYYQFKSCTVPTK